jgi:hypothetical protein
VVVAIVVIEWEMSRKMMGETERGIEISRERERERDGYGERN